MTRGPAPPQWKDPSPTPLRRRAGVYEGEALVVESDQVAKPVAVRFAWNELAEPNLFNGARLPASPFRTDDFPLLTNDAK